MKMRIALLLLVLALGALAVLWLRQRQRAEEQKVAYTARIQLLSNDLTVTEQKLSDQTTKLSEQTQLRVALEQNLEVQRADASQLSNQLSNVQGDLAKTRAAAQAEAEAAKEEMSKRDARIAELEGERDQLTKRMSELNVAITDLETKIGDTQRKLAASEGDREFLLKELKRLQAEKAELERQFSDLAVLREQVRKLKEELSISRRLDWIRRGLYGTTVAKGAELLQRGMKPTVRTNYDLNVEVRQEGSARVVPPAGTNVPVPAPVP